jgi:hypothetical protein
MISAVAGAKTVCIKTVESANLHFLADVRYLEMPMTIQYFDSPFHVTHGEELASKMVGEMELSILTNLIKKPSVKENQAATKSDETDSSSREITIGKTD